MDKLYLKTENGNMPIEPGMVEKYNLKKGSMSPFTCCRVVDESGDGRAEESEKISKESIDEIKKTPGIVYTTSEILDIAQGTDS